LICAWTGAASICESGQVFDLSVESKRIGAVLSKEKLGTQYLKRFSEELRRSFTDQINAIFDKYPTSALFVGYCGKLPTILGLGSQV
jgi:hypothetical protein